MTKFHPGSPWIELGRYIWPLMQMSTQLTTDACTLERYLRDRWSGKTVEQILGSSDAANEKGP